MLGIQQEEDESSILTLSLKDSSPERADDVLNMLITVYNEDAINDKNQVAVNTANFINERLIIIEKELGGVESDLESFKRSNQIVDIGSTAGRYMGESQKFNADAIELETQIRLARYIKTYLEDPNRELDLIPANTGIKDMNIETQINQYNAARLRRDKLIADSSEQNPVVEELNNSLHSMKQSIIRAVDNMIVNLNVRRTDAQSHEMRAQARVSAIPTKERQMLSIERQQKIKEALYLFLLNRREENALSQAMADNNARIIDSTDGSTAPIAPNRNRILLLGILVGLAIPGVSFLMVLFMDTRVHNRKDVQGAVSVPFLGEVPLDKQALHSADDESAAETEEEKSRAVAEAMRILRTNMAFIARRQQRMQVITFTSFNEGAGKTFIARHLAMSFIYAKKRVVLVDLDLRKGTLSRHLSHHHAGVSNYLADTSLTIDDVLQRGTDGQSPDIIPAAPSPPIRPSSSWTAVSTSSSANCVSVTTTSSPTMCPWASSPMRPSPTALQTSPSSWCVQAVWTVASCPTSRPSTRSRNSTTWPSSSMASTCAAGAMATVTVTATATEAMAATDTTATCTAARRKNNEHQLNSNRNERTNEQKNV